MNHDELAAERDFYSDQLRENILPFWMKYGCDEEAGGYHTCLNRDGSVYDYDKPCTWPQGRMMWTFAYLYNNWRQEPEWLEFALHGMEFMRKFGFDPSGRVYFGLTRTGAPLVKSCDIFAELSLGAGFAECAAATGDDGLMKLARKCVLTAAEIVENPESNPHRRYVAATRPTSLHAEHMILLNTCQRMREIEQHPRYDAIISRSVDQILSIHYRPELQVCLEAAAPDGGVLPGTMGRWIIPGHMIELGWFLIHEGRYQRSDELIEKGLNVIDWGMQWGWDSKCGGLVNDVDVEGHFILGPRFPYAPMKLWWAPAEALYATLLAWSATRDDRFLSHYRKVKEHALEHFADDAYGEWYAFLDPQNNVLAGSPKGTEKKNAFHIVRSFYYCYRLLASMMDDHR